MPLLPASKATPSAGKFCVFLGCEFGILARSLNLDRGLALWCGGGLSWISDSSQCRLNVEYQIVNHSSWFGGSGHGLAHLHKQLIDLHHQGLSLVEEHTRVGIDHGNRSVSDGGF